MRLILTGLLLATLLLAEGPTVRLERESAREFFRAEGFRIPVGGQPEEFFAVYVDSLAAAPAVAGTYSVERDSVVFEPRYPLSPGLRYRAELTLAVGPPVIETFAIPELDRSPSTFVRQVYPTAGRLPENLLKFYVHFSASMSRGEAYRRIRLIREPGETVELPFLEIDQELWDAENRRLTLLFDPGRIKRGLVPNKEVGMALRQEHRYTLFIDRGWIDAEGQPLKESFRKSFTAGPSDRQPPDISRWKLTVPAAGDLTPLTVEFPEPMDHALLQRVIVVTTASGNPIPGAIQVDREETRWVFTPKEAWKAGRYQVEAQTILEDLAGNSLGRPFEVNVFERVEDRIVGKTVTRPFRVEAK